MPTIRQLLTPDEVRLLAYVPTLPGPLGDFLALEWTGTRAALEQVLYSYYTQIPGFPPPTETRPIAPFAYGPGFSFYTDPRNKKLTSDEAEAIQRDFPGGLEGYYRDSGESRGVVRYASPIIDFPSWARWLSAYLQVVRGKAPPRAKRKAREKYQPNVLPPGNPLSEQIHPNVDDPVIRLELINDSRQREGLPPLDRLPSDIGIGRVAPGDEFADLPGGRYNFHYDDVLEARRQPPRSPRARQPRQPTQNPLGQPIQAPRARQRSRNPLGSADEAVKPKRNPLNVSPTVSQSGYAQFRVGDLVVTPQGLVARITRIEGRLYYIGGTTFSLSDLRVPDA